MTKEIFLPYPIVVKKQTVQLSLVLDAHPGQVANVGDRVPMSIVVN
jgi:hypothetical protein